MINKNDVLSKLKDNTWLIGIIFQNDRRESVNPSS